jgi:hypothetical protein
VKTDTRAALEASIKHWEENVAAETAYDVKIGPNECALCRMYWEQHNCGECPVAAATGEPECDLTPFVDAWRAWGCWRESDDMRDAWRQAAQAELDFLKSLRTET